MAKGALPSADELVANAMAANFFTTETGDAVASELEPARQRADWCVKCGGRVAPAGRVTDVALRPVRQRCKVHGDVLQIDAAAPQPAQGVVIYWSDITPADAVGIALPMANIEGPLVRAQAEGADAETARGAGVKFSSEEDFDEFLRRQPAADDPGVGVVPPVVCPWPWDAQQMATGAPAACKYCGALVVPGMPHPDARFEGLHREFDGGLGL